MDRIYRLRELKPGLRKFHTERSKVAQGKTGNGKPYFPTVSYEYFETPSGPMEFSVWLENVKMALKKEELNSLYREIIKYVSKNCAWLKGDEQIELYAAECLCRESYKAWEDFGIKA